MSTHRSKTSGAPRAATTLTAAFAALALILSGCIDSATTESSDTTLAPLVAPSFVTLAPSTSATLVGDTTTTTAPPNVDPNASLATTPTAGSDPAATAATAPSSTAVVSADGTYTVVANDTVYGIARKHGVSAETLAQLNSWSDGATHGIFPGDTVKVPDGATATTAGSNSSGSTTTTVKSPTSTSVAAGGNNYVIEAGDYLALIATKTGTTVNAIVEVNGWSDGVNHLIIEGQTIKLPAKAG